MGAEPVEALCASAGLCNRHEFQGIAVAHAHAVCYNCHIDRSLQRDWRILGPQQRTSNVMRLTLAAVQMHAVSHNVRKACEFVQYAVEQGTKIVALPEFFNIDHPLHEMICDYAESLEGMTVAWLRDGLQSLDRSWLTRCLFAITATFIIRCFLQLHMAFCIYVESNIAFWGNNGSARLEKLHSLVLPAKTRVGRPACVRCPL